MRCPKCNKQNHDESIFCMYCGCNLKEYSKGSFLGALFTVVRWFVGGFIILLGIISLSSNFPSKCALILAGVFCLPVVTKRVPTFRARSAVLICLPIVLIFMSIMFVSESDITIDAEDEKYDVEASVASHKEADVKKKNTLPSAASSKSESLSKAVVVATFTQEINDTGEKPTKIELYDDGKIELICDLDNENRVYHGHYLYGEDIINPGSLDCFFNCWIEDHETIKNLTFRLSYTFGVEIVTFCTEFNNGEFGNTFAGDVFTMEVHDASKLCQHRGDTYFNEVVDESYNVFLEPYVTVGKVFLDGDIRNDIDKFIISDEINYKKDCVRLSINYDNAARNADYFRGNKQAYCGSVYACVNDALLLDTAAGRVIVAFPEGYNPGIMVNDRITAYGILSGTVCDPQTYNYVPYLLAKYIDGGYNADSVDSRIGAELLDLNGKWQECNLFWMPYYDDEYIIIDNTTIYDNESSLVSNYVIQSIEKKRSLYGEDYFELIIKKTFEDGSGGTLKANYYYLYNRLEFGSMQSFYQKVE